MSHIPNSAMPHAGAANEDQKQQDQGGSATLTEAISERAGKVADYARENPKTAIAAGAALAVGAIAAAAIPLMKGRSSKSSSSSGSRAKSSSGGTRSGSSKSGGSKSGGKSKA